MILTDTSVWIDYLRDRASPETVKLDQLLTDRAEKIVMGDLVLAEILQGFGDDRQATLIQHRLSVLRQITICNPSLAIQAARNFRALRQHGVTVRKTIDTLIATRCIVDGHALLHRDRDFQPFVDHLGLVDAMTL